MHESWLWRYLSVWERKEIQRLLHEPPQLADFKTYSLWIIKRTIGYKFFTHQIFSFISCFISLTHFCAQLIYRINIFDNYESKFNKEIFWNCTSAVSCDLHYHPFPPGFGDSFWRWRRQRSRWRTSERSFRFRVGSFGVLHHILCRFFNIYTQLLPVKAIFQTA